MRHYSQCRYFRHLAACSVVLLLLTLATSAWGQSQTSAVPRLIKFSGVVKDAEGKARTGTVGVTFALYKDQQGGAPLWLETQNVQADAQGRYSVYLGSTKSAGLPQDVFVSGEAHWLGVQPEEQTEQPRTLLLSVPYALKAGDAETVGGLPASAFVLAAPSGGSAGAQGSGNSFSDSTGQPPVGGSGTQNFVPLWTDNSGTLGNSVMFQSGTGSSAKTGVNTTAPASTLDVNGSVIARGPVQLPSTGTATAGGGFSSQPFSLQGSSFNSSNQQAIGPLFQWQTEPTGNNSSTPAGTLNLLYGNGSGLPGETGLNIASNGKITFATGQTFPGAGTITGITAGTGLTGGGTSGNVTLSINIPFANQFYAQLGAANTFTKNQTVNANLIAKQLISTATQGTVPLQVTSTTLVPNLNASLLGGLSASAFQPVGSYATLGGNSFNGDQNVTGNTTATGTVTGGVVNAVTSFNLGGSAFGFGSRSSGSVFLGFSGNFTSTGAGNTANGMNALVSNGAGAYNSANGYYALGSNSAGSYNSASGDHALYSNTAGSLNSAVGYEALYQNTGSNNSAVGASALVYNTSGTNNSALGINAGPDSNSPNLTNSTALGANAVVSKSNALVLGGTGSNAVSVGIGTATPASTLDVHGTGNFTGLITFAPGQTFPGTGAGTITGVTAGLDLTGGGSTGNVTLNVDTTKVVTGVVAGTDLTGGGTGGVQTLNLDTTKVPQLNVANTFNANQAVNGNLTVSGTASGGVVNAGTAFDLASGVFLTGSLQNLNAYLGYAGNQTSTGVANTAVGVGTLWFNTTGFNNTATGATALEFNTTGSENSATGMSALFSNTTGSSNTATGFSALITNATGGSNTATGADALVENVGGSQNTAEGIAALGSNTSGSNNAGSGAVVLWNNTTGNNNAALGYNSLGYNTTGSNNTAVGSSAGVPSSFALTTGSNDTFVGANSSPGTQTNLVNATAIGANAAVTVNNAMVLGSINGVNGATADTNVGIGTTAPAAKLDVRGTGNFTGPITFAAGQTFPGTGTITGVTAGTDLTGGGTSGSVTLSVDTTKVVTGVTAGTDLTGGGTGGVQTLNLDTTKVPQLNSTNTFTADQTILGNINSSRNFFGAGVDVSAYYLGGTLFAFGSSGSANAFLGFAGNTTSIGGGNTGSGFLALARNTLGSSNTASGELALENNTEGAFNSAFGGALINNSKGSFNTGLGADALWHNVTGSNNTGVGYLAGPDISQPSLSNTTAVGSNADVTQSNSMVLGSINGINSATADTFVGIGTTAPQTLLHIDHKPPAGVGQDLLLITSGQTSDVASLLLQNTGPGLRLRVGAGTDSTYLASSGPLEFVTGDTGNPDHPAAPAIFIDATGKVGIGESGPGRILEVARGSGHAIADGWDVYSSRRWKTNIQTLPDALGKVEQLRGVSYDLKDSGKHEIGVIAEEVGKVVPELVSYEANGKDARGVDYSRLTALLIEAVKQQQKQVHNQQREIASLRTQLRQQAAKNALLESRLDKVEKGHESTDPKLAMYQKPVTAGPLRGDHDNRQGMER